MSVEDFYDGLAEDYHLVYADRWDEAVAGQGAALAAVIRALSPDAADVLDCSCGIGTQAIGLALQGYAVTGTDISAASVARAREEAERLGAAVEFGVADFRDLDGVDGDFDVVLSCDNALPHLLADADVDAALAAMHGKLRPGGALLVSVRDYDTALVTRPVTAPPQVIEGPPRQVVVRLHEWDAPGSSLYTVRFLVLTESADGWSVREHAGRYRAVTRAALSAAAAGAGFEELHWHAAAEVGYHQPLLTARR